MKYYLLDGRTPVPCDLLEWSAWREKNNPRVAEDQIGDVWISTVFLGLDHNWRGGSPLLFETMTFSPSFGQIQMRCSTYMQAEEMHQSVVDLAREAHEQAKELGEDVVRRAMAGSMGAE